MIPAARLILVVLMLLPCIASATSYLDMPRINESTPGFSIAPGDYDAVQVTVPLGSYLISFLTRVENVSFTGKYWESYMNRSAGSGKDYHICTYDLGRLWVIRNTSTDRYEDVYGNVSFGEKVIEIQLYRYVGPTSFPAIDPDPYGLSTVTSWHETSTTSWDYTDPESITIDGKTGTLCMWWQTIHNYGYYPSQDFDVYGKEHYVATYQPDDKTYVVMETSDIDYDKDVALVLETLHISV